MQRVRWLAEAPLGTGERVRKVEVLGCKWPGDEEPDGSIKFFKRYVKVRFPSF